MSYFVIEIDPNAKYEWNRLAIRNPMTGDNPDLKELFAAALGGQPGHYLAKVSITVEVLESCPLQPEEEPHLAVCA